MFFNKGIILDSINRLSDVHPFYGITYLVCKKHRLPIDSTIQLALDAENLNFLKENHRLSPNSEFYFQPFRSTKKWLVKNYASSGLQAINTQTFKDAFLHDKGSQNWGWAKNYAQVLENKLPKNGRLPIISIAIWLYKYQNFKSPLSAADLVNKFIDEYNISQDEIKALFDNSENIVITTEQYQSNCVEWDELKGGLPQPPDSLPENGGTLAVLSTKNIGPAQEFQIEPAERLNLITGDNGLGKTFILEAAWWALTNTWTDRIAYPDPRKRDKEVTLEFSIKGNSNALFSDKVHFDWTSQTWPFNSSSRPTIPGLIVYARVDGSYAVWDPARQISTYEFANNKRDLMSFNNDEIWNGKAGKIEGLIRDWVSWQNSQNNERFKQLEKALEKLSPPDLGILKPGKPVRIPFDPREIPTIIHPYGEIPVINASAGVKRIIALAYLIVWAWNEHLVQSELMNTSPQGNMVVLIDELEAHLHPKWQRAFLPSLIELNKILYPSLKIQFIIATHSPLVMASSEEVFVDDTDALFHLQLQDDGNITLDQIDFIKYGDVSNWLMSPIFELKQARSQEGELAIEDAKQIQAQSKPSNDDITAVTVRLKKYLSANDKFWPRWVMFAEIHGVEL